MKTSIHAMWSVTEEIEGNYSTPQLFYVMDFIVGRALYPVFLCSSFLESSLLHTVSWYIESFRKKKISVLERHHLSAIAIQISMEPSIDEKVRLYLSMKIERNLTLLLIGRWLKLASGYTSLAVSGEAPLRLSSIEAACLVHNRSYFLSCIQEATFWTKETEAYIGSLAQKYMRLAANEALRIHRRSKANPAIVTDIDELSHNMMLGVLRAIHKCDPESGTLTSMVTSWMQSAKNTRISGAEYGIAYVVPSSKKKEVFVDNTDQTNAYVDIEDEENRLKLEEVEDETDSAHNAEDRLLQLRLLAKELDPSGIARLSLGIREVLPR